MGAGALIRHSFVARHKAHVTGARVPWEQAVVGCLVLLGLVFWLAPPPPSAQAQAAAAKPATIAEVRAVVDQRCVMCHNAQLAQKNVQLHTNDGLKQHAQAVYQQAVLLKLMPLNNATQITDDERALIKRWFEAGSPVN
jgi:uncharacterized membrane protein